MFALVDDEDFEFLSKFKWYAWRGKKSKTFYARCHEPGCGRKHRKIYMHRLILYDAFGEIDHINGQGLDNRRSNLRVVTHRQQMCNVGLRSDSRWKFKGIQKHNNKWMARITSSGVRHYIGLYSSQEEAARAYDCEAKKLHGEFARTNFQ